MNVPKGVTKVIDKLRYDVDTSRLLAHRNYDSGNVVCLYRTTKGNFFALWTNGEMVEIEPITLDGAVAAYQEWLLAHDEPFDQAFPDMAIEDA